MRRVSPVVLVLVMASACGRLGYDPIDAGLALDAPRMDAALDAPGPDAPTPDAPGLDAPAVDAPADAPTDDAPGALSVTAIEPPYLLPTGGDLVLTLAGDLAALAITVDGAPCAPIVVLDATHARCTAAAHAPDIVSLRATNGAGGVADLAAAVVYLTPGAYQTGGPADDRSSGVAVDREGSIYVSGGTTGALGGPSAGDFDAMLVKYDAAGRLLWTRQLGTSVWDYARDVAIDQATGDVLIVGYGAGDIDGDGVTAGGTDLFVARYSGSGALLWVRQVGSAGNDEAWDLAVDAGGNAVISAWTDGAFAGATNAGGLDYAIVRLARDGTFLWARQDGTALDDQGHSVGVAPDGTAYLVGYTLGVLETGGTNAGLRDVFVARYGADGARAWIRQRGGAGQDRAQDVTVDGAGRPWLVGSTDGSIDGQPNAGGTDVFVMRFATDGAWELTRQRGSPGTENTFGVVVDSSGRVLLSSNTSQVFDGQPYAGGANDFCVIAWNADGTHAFTRSGGSAGSDAASSIALAPNGLVYVSIITDASLDGVAPRGLGDVAVVKLDPSGGYL
jgi:hypothetical protein